MIAALAAADFKERTRRLSFLSVMGAALLAAFYFVPSQNGSFRTLIISSDKFIQAGNPTWIPLATAVIAGVFLPIAGFALCMNNIKAESESGLSFALQAQGMSRLKYTASKFISNALLLIVLLGVMLLGSVCMIGIRFFMQPITIWSIISPFLAVMPGLIFTAAAAVFCECVPVFRKASALCIAAYVIFSFAMLVNATYKTGGITAIFDISGFGWLHNSIENAAGGDVAITVLGGGAWIGSEGTQQLVFGGLSTDNGFGLNKLLLLGFSILLIFPSAAFMQKKPSVKHLLNIKRHKAKKPIMALPFYKSNKPFLNLYSCELKRIISELPVFWFICEGGLIIASIFAPVQTVYDALIPIIFGIAVLPFARLGASGHLNGIDDLLKTVYNGTLRKASAEGLAGLTLSLLISAAAIIRGFAFYGLTGGFSLLLFALASPAAGFALGKICKTSRVFELVFLTLLFVMLNAPNLVLIR